MSSAADKDNRSEETGAGNLPAVTAGAPKPPAPVERLDAQPEDVQERFAFALWNAGRKEEAVAFLEEQIARQKADATTVPPVIIDMSPSERPAPPRPPLPLRPFVFGATALAVAILLAWPLFKGVATFGGWSDGTEIALLADDAPPATTVPPAEPGAEAEVAVTVHDVTPGSVQTPPADIAEAEAADIPAPPASAMAGQDDVAGETTLVAGDEVALVPSEAAADGATPVTLASLADDVLNAARLPRPRPEPSAEVVAALSAPLAPPRAPTPAIVAPLPAQPAYAQGARQPTPVVIPAPPSDPNAPRPTVNEPRRFTIIGRVGEERHISPPIQVQRHGAAWPPVRSYPPATVYPYQPLPWGYGDQGPIAYPPPAGY